MFEGNSIDSMIHWLREQRQCNRDVPLGELIELASLSDERLIDIACIDLIERKRIHPQTVVEDLLREVTRLAGNRDAILDLIDAEICVRLERGESVEAMDYEGRFPNLVGAFAAMIRPGDLNGVALSANSAEVLAEPSSLMSLGDFVLTPSWFTREKVQSASPQSCLIRGRDCERHRAVALKIVYLPDELTMRQIDHLLCVVETASLATHTAWVAPDLAAIQHGALAVIRPWIFGSPWEQARRLAPMQTKLHDLARVGYALQAAHDTRGNYGAAAHGGLHVNNLIVDNDGEIKIVDAISNSAIAIGQSFQSEGIDADVRRRRDVRDFAAIVREVVAPKNGTQGSRRQLTPLEKLCDRLIAQNETIDGCGTLADGVLKFADSSLNRSSY